MASDIVRAPAIAYAQGSAPSMRGDASPRVLHQASGEVMQMAGLSLEWEGEDHRYCTVYTKAGNPCKSPPLDGADICVGHLRAREAQEKRNSGGE